MRTKCFSVRLESLYRISEKACKAISFDGSSDIIPSSCIFGQDNEVLKSNAYWIAAWILPKKKIQYSNKKEAWFDEKGKRLPSIMVDKYTPKKITAVKDNKIKELER